MEVEAEYSFAVAFDHKAATVGRADHKAATVGRAWAKAATVGRAWAKAATVGRAWAANVRFFRPRWRDQRSRLYGDDVANTCDVNVYG